MSTIICIKTRYSYEPNHRRLCRLETGSQLNNAETTDCPVTLREAEGMAEVLESLPSAPQGQFMDLAYGYGYVGNILGLANTASIPPQNELGGPTRQTFVYDELYRLTKADGSFSPSRSTEHQYSLDMSYDSIHNITRKDQEHISLRNGSKSRTQRDTTYDWSYSYNKSGVGSIRPHAPTHIGNRTFSYDANGNQTGWDNDDNGSRRSITWDEENRIQAIGDPSNTLVFAYDDTGTRMLKRNQQGQTVYVNQFFTVRNQALSSKHIFAGTTRIATKMEPGQPVGTSSNTSTTTTTTTTTSTAIQSTETSLLDQVIQTATDVVDQVASLLGISEDSAHPGQGLAHRNERANDVAQNTVKNPNLNGTFPGGGDNGNNGNGNSGGNSGGNNGGDNNGGGNSGGNNGGGNTGGGSDPLLSGGDFLYYYHPDHLGSTSHVTDDKGDLYEHITYFPFGETWVQESANTLQRVPYRFTSKEFDEETGLYYFGARYYDPRTSVWQSPDPILGDYLNGKPNGGVYNSLNLGLFTYSYNNPILFVDPDGNATLTFDKNITNQKIKTVTANLNAVEKRVHAQSTGAANTRLVEKFDNWNVHYKGDQDPLKSGDQSKAGNAGSTRGRQGSSDIYSGDQDTLAHEFYHTVTENINLKSPGGGLRDTKDDLTEVGDFGARDFAQDLLSGENIDKYSIGQELKPLQREQPRRGLGKLFSDTFSKESFNKTWEQIKWNFGVRPEGE